MLTHTAAGFLVPICLGFVVFRQALFRSGALIYRDHYPGEWFLPLLRDAKPLDFATYLENFKFAPLTGPFHLFFDFWPIADPVAVMYFSAFLVAYLSMYWSCYSVLKHRFRYADALSLGGATVAAVTFTLNPLAINLLYDLSLFTGYAVTPLVIVLYDSLLRGDLKLHDRVLSVFTLAFLWWMFGIKSTWLILMPVLLALWFAGQSVLDLRRRRFRNIINNVLVTLSVGFVYTLLSSFWLLPYLKAVSLESLEATGLPTDIDHIRSLVSYSFVDSLRLQGIYWPWVDWTTPVGRSQWLWGPIAFLPAALGLVGWALHYRNRLALSCAGLCVLAMIVTNVPELTSSLLSSPIGGYLTPIRTPYKWNVFLSLGLAFLVGMAVARGLALLRRSVPLNVSVLAVSGPILLLFLYYLPGLTGDFDGNFHPVTLPAELDQMVGTLEESDDCTVVWLPVLFLDELTWNPKESPSFYNMSDLTPGRSVLGLGPPGDRSTNMPYIQHVYAGLADGRLRNISKYLLPANVCWVVFHDDLAASKDNLTGSSSEAALVNLKASDLKLEQQAGFLSGFFLENSPGLFYVPERSFLTVGGLTTLNSLATLPDFDPVGSGLIFVDRSNDKLDLADAGFILGPRSSYVDLLLSYMPDDLLVSPSEYASLGDPGAGWAYMDPRYYEWYHYARNVADIDPPGEFDYERGLAVSSYRPSPEAAEKSIDLSGLMWSASGWTRSDQIEVIQQGLPVQIQYRFGAPSSSHVLMDTSIGVQDWTYYDTASLDVLGDASGNSLELWLKRGLDGTTYKVGSVRLDWRGWRRLEFSLPWPRDYMRGLVISIRWEKDRYPSSAGPHRLGLGNLDLSAKHASVRQAPVLKVPFKVQESADHEVYLRVLLNPQGGEMEVSVDDGLPTVIGTEAPQSQLAWQRVTGIHLSRGEHELAIVNRAGLNAVNVLAVASAGDIRTMEEALDKRLHTGNVIVVTDTSSEAAPGSVSSEKPIEVSIPSDDEYVLAARPGDGAGLEGARVVVDGTHELQLEATPSRREPCCRVGPIHLTQGKHSLELPAIDQPAQVILYSGQEDASLTEILGKADSAPVVAWRRHNASKYTVTVATDRPFVLGFADLYDPRWSALVNGQKAGSFPLYGIVNGFYIEQTGDLEIIVEFEPQRCFLPGMVLTGLTLGVFLVLVGGRVTGRLARLRWPRRLEDARSQEQDREAS